MRRSVSSNAILAIIGGLTVIAIACGPETSGSGEIVSALPPGEPAALASSAGGDAPISSLRAAADATTGAFDASVSGESLTARDDGSRETDGITPVTLGPGVYDFTLPSIGGEQVQLSSLVAQGEVVIVFYRAVW